MHRIITQVHVCKFGVLTRKHGYTQWWTYQQYELEAYGSGFFSGGMINIDRADPELQSEGLDSAKKNVSITCKCSLFHWPFGKYTGYIYIHVTASIFKLVLEMFLKFTASVAYTFMSSTSLSQSIARGRERLGLLLDTSPSQMM